MKEIKRGQIWYADLSPVVGSEQGAYRPVLIIQNDIGNKYSPTTIVANITSRNTKAKIVDIRDTNYDHIKIVDYTIPNYTGEKIHCERMIEVEVKG